MRLFRYIFFFEGAFVFFISFRKGVFDPIFIVDIFDITHDEWIIMRCQQGAVRGVWMPTEHRKIVLEDSVDLSLEPGV